MDRGHRNFPNKSGTSSSKHSKVSSVYTIEQAGVSGEPKKFLARIKSYDLEEPDLQAWLDETFPEGDYGHIEV